jgi:hypothetical protein
MRDELIETPASVTILAVSYRARCTEVGSTNLGCVILRYADAGGRPTSHPVLCLAHYTREGGARPGGRAQGYNDRPATREKLVTYVTALIQQDRDDLVRAFLTAVKEAEGVLTPNVAQKLASYP